MATKRKIWTLEKLQKKALKFKTRQEFRKGAPSAYVISWRRGFLDVICSHMKPSASEPYSLDELSLEALKYNTRGEFSNKNSSAYAAAIKRGILNQICSHMKYVRIYWTNEMLAKEALNHKNRGEFSKNAHSAYQSAYLRNILDQICDHMPPPLTEAYTLDELQIEALKYNTRGEFSSSGCSAYVVARTRGVLDQICAHMKRARGSSVAEKELFAIVKAIYPQTKKFKDCKVNIPNKPYIHGFEIDILVENKGIEFDGKYHHSFDFMRKTSHKALWSDDDIRNYHQIKDSWFASKGIKILHIKEVDWKKDKKKCVKRCLDFLNSH